MIALGIDIGSRNTKLVVYDASCSQLLFSEWQATDVKPLKSVDDLKTRAQEVISPLQLERCGVTGYGRKLMNTATKVYSEISCHAKGVSHFYPDVRTIIDIGGQDSKIILLSSHGKIQDFVMNDKCAAGTGRFLEMTALRLGLSLETLDAIVTASDNTLHMNSTCVVFAESEIIGMIAENASTADIVKAVYDSISRRVLAQLTTLDFKKPIVFTGGVAQSSQLVNNLALQLDSEIWIPPDPEITGALGAAILVSE